jgi:hypothetical protein
MSPQAPLALEAEIEQLLAKVSGEQATSADVQRLAALLMSFYEAGLARMLEVVREDARGGAIIDRLRADPLVRSLLSAHDLLPGEHVAPPLLQIIRPSESRRHDHRSPDGHPCELCAQSIPEGHGHVVDVERRRLLCVCGTCSGVGGRFRRVPSRYVRLPPMTVAQWEALGFPVGLVFLVANSPAGTVTASYPGPAGATESVLPLDMWPALVEERPDLRDLAPDVEALLVRRVGDEYRCYIVPIDACYELIGRIRRAWTGFGGGTAVEAEIDRFFGSVVQRASSSAEVWA